MWHCPHCGAPQAETARCWVCHKSSTTCSTCRHFRASLVTEIGYCALDRARKPLTGRELRGCWTERPAADPAAAVPSPSVASTFSPAQPLLQRGFIPLEDLRPIVSAPDAADPPPIVLLADALEGGDPRTSLFGELDR